MADDRENLRLDLTGLTAYEAMHVQTSVSTALPEYRIVATVPMSKRQFDPVAAVGAIGSLVGAIAGVAAWLKKGPRTEETLRRQVADHLLRRGTMDVKIDSIERFADYVDGRGPARVTVAGYVLHVYPNRQTVMLQVTKVT